jgi:hypothetical protein
LFFGAYAAIDCRKAAFRFLEWSLLVGEMIGVNPLRSQIIL